MEAEDAQKALRLAFKHDASGDTAAAIKWAKKSIAIYKTPSAEALLVRLEKNGASGNGASTSASASASTSTAAGASSSTEGLRSRTAGTSNGRATSDTTNTAPKRAYTQAQMEVVTRIKKAGADFYQVLGVEKTVDDNGIKKAYKKLALQLHPDKNGAPGADEAFKAVSKAFTILTDADKRAAYDRYGGDPDNSRSAAGAAAAGHANPFGGMRGTPFRGGGMYADEIDPNDLFNMFFGGGMGGAQFGGTTFSFGGPGLRTHQFRQQRPGPRRAQAEPQNANILLQLLPLLVLGLFSLLAYAPSLFSTPDPSFTWSPSHTYKTQRVTEPHHVKYYVNDNQFNNHPFVTGDNSKKDLAGFEKRVENAYKQAMYSSCERQREYQERRLASTRGFLGIGADEAAAKKILEEVYESCENLKPFGIYM